MDGAAERSRSAGVCWMERYLKGWVGALWDVLS
jgi:hypothetical protein